MAATEGGSNAPIDDPVQGMESFLDEDATTTSKEHDGFRQKMMRNRILFGVVILLLLGLMIGVIVALTTGGTQTVNSFESATGHEYMLSAKMMVHPMHGGDLDPSGSVTISFDDDDHFLITTKVEGVEQYCENCKIEVYSKTSCFSETGPPYWHHKMVRNNPWDRVHYHAANFETHSSVASFTGHGPKAMEGRVVVMDDSNGMHIACGILERDTAPRRVRTLHAKIGNLPAYTMTSVNGVASVQFFEDDTFIFNFIIEGLPHLCSHCEISIQEGTSCEPSEIGSHFFDHVELEKDPYAITRGVFYNSDVRGFGQRSFFLYNGYGYEQNQGHAVLLKGPDGSRMACGILGAKRITPNIGQKVK